MKVGHLLDSLQSPLGPNLTGLPENPPGNTLARDLRRVAEDTGSIFPSSVYTSSAAQRARWSSTYQDGYKPDMTQSQLQLPMRGRSNGFSASAADRKLTGKTFMSWKIPDRLSTAGPSRVSSGLRSADGYRLGTPATPGGENVPSRFPTIHNWTKTDGGKSPGPASRASSGRLPSAQVPTSAREPRSATAAAPAPERRGSRASARSLPSQSASARDAPRPRDITAVQWMTPGEDDTDMRSRDGVGDNCGDQRQRSGRTHPRGLGKSYRVNEILAPYYHPQVAQKIDQVDSAVVAKALAILGREQRGREPVKALEEWLQTASEEERAVALNFFQSPTGTQLLESSPKLGVETVHTLFRLLDKGRAGLAYDRGTGPRAPAEGEGLRYLRLLTPGTRNNKWMHQTWHHLPSHPVTNPVNHSGAVYSQAQRILPTHYTVHPELG